MTPLPLIGNMDVLFTMRNSFYLYLSDVYKDPKMSKAAAVGIYILTKPALVLREPELIKSVLIKEFPKFSNRSAGCDPHDDALGSNNMFFIRNPQWRDLRSKISPTFTTGKIKQMYPLMTDVSTPIKVPQFCINIIYISLNGFIPRYAPIDQHRVRNPFEFVCKD